MTFEEVLAIITAVLASEKLNPLKTNVLRGMWHEESYYKIASDLGYDESYIQDVGAELCQLLTKKLGIKVKKLNLQVALVQYVQTRALPGFLQSKWVNCREAMDVSVLCGRTEELAKLEPWLVQDRCRLVAVLGMGGIGKTALSVKLAQQVQNEFKYVIWRSLLHAPPIGEMLADLILFLSEQQEIALPETINGRILRLMEYLHSSRCLLILDNVESILRSGSCTGQYLEGYEGYGELLRQVGEVPHQSCLLLTSREKPREVASQQGKGFLVRSLEVFGLKEVEGQEVLALKGLSGSESDLKTLVERYAGNPLALKIVATTIMDVFSGDIKSFLQHGITVFGDIQDLLKQQFDRLSNLESEVMYWLAINRETVSLLELQEDIVSPVSQSSLLEAMESLVRRSLIERNANSFTLQPVLTAVLSWVKHSNSNG